MPEQLDMSRLHDPSALNNQSSMEPMSHLKDVCQWVVNEGKDIVVTSKADENSNDKYYLVHISSDRILLVDKSSHSKQELEFSSETGAVTRNGNSDVTAEDQLIERLRKIQGDIQRNDARIFGRKLNASS